MYKNIIAKLEQIIMSSEARKTYSGSNLQREVKSLDRDALSFCVKHHTNQIRDDGEPYYLHPMRVAAYAEHYIKGVNPFLVRNICLLHDVVEDCDVSYNDIKGQFGEFVADHVQDLTNVYTKESYPDLNRKDRKLREHNRLAYCNNLVKQIKLIDRMDNCSPIKFAKNSKYLEETVDLISKIGNSNLEIKTLIEGKLTRWNSK